MKKRVMSNLSTNLCKATLSMALNSLEGGTEGCTWLLYEQKQPESLKKTDIKSLRMAVKKI